MYKSHRSSSQQQTYEAEDIDEIPSSNDENHHQNLDGSFPNPLDRSVMVIASTIAKDARQGMTPSEMMMVDDENEIEKLDEVVFAEDEIPSSTSSVIAMNN